MRAVTAGSVTLEPAGAETTTWPLAPANSGKREERASMAFWDWVPGISKASAIPRCSSPALAPRMTMRATQRATTRRRRRTAQWPRA
jgi:hypothetical protein